MLDCDYILYIYYGEIHPPMWQTPCSDQHNCTSENVWTFWYALQQFLVATYTLLSKYNSHVSFSTIE
jgi:hypothetical protein